MKNIFVIITILFFHVLVFSQKESANWYFGEAAGLNFKSINPVALLDGKLITLEGCATISDRKGNLLFYTDGVTVWDRRHEIMPNGQDLLGHSSSTESALIVPKPGSKSIYYLFTIDKPSYYFTKGEPIDGVNYSEIDLSANNGYGDIVPTAKNIHLVTYNTSNTIENEYKSTEKITAVTHKDGSSIWVITYFMNRFYSFKVDSTGVNSSPIISRVPQLINPVFNNDGSNITAIGYLKVSPNGKKIAIAHSSTAAGSPRSGTKKSGKIILYDFDNNTGTVSNELQLLNNIYPYGVEFSPNSKLLYATVNIFDSQDFFVQGDLHQFNLESADIRGSDKIIISSQNIAGALQLAINGKVYRAGYKVSGTGSSISVINNPNNLGAACNYSENSVSLGGKSAKLGLPPFVQSIFLYTFEYEFTCLNNQTHFFITSEEPYDSVIWDFGDGNTSTNDDPYHIYLSPGVYTVSLTMSLNGIQTEPLVKQVIISEPPQVLSSTYDLIQCDFFDDNPNDGLTTYNLEKANEPISLSTSEAIQVYYYHSVADANIDILNINSINYIYKNTVADEILYAKVFKTNTDCFNIATVRLKTNKPVDVGNLELFGCDFENNQKANFDLDSEGKRIATELNLSTNSQVSFYEKENDASIGINALPEIYNSRSKSIYVRADSNNACFGSGILKLNVKTFPELSNQEIKVCTTEFPIQINTGINFNEISDFKYLWNTSETTNEIAVHQAGIYEVTIYDENINCERNVIVNVKQNIMPSINEIVIEGHSIKVILDNMSDESFEFALDDINSTFQESNQFINIKEGLHQVFIKDARSCEIISKEFYIFGFPKYFTPNSDGTNDTWNVFGLDPTKYNSERIYIAIYNRYGKLLKTFNPLTTTGWNGTFNGKLLSPDDYWYYLKLPDGEVYRGHFTLKM